MTHAQNRKARRSPNSKSRGRGLKPSSDPKASAKQIRYVEWLRIQFDPLSCGSAIPDTKVEAGGEIARLLQLKAKYETATRPPKEGRRLRGSGQYRYG